MASDVVMPQMGFDMTEGTVARWLKSEGDAVTRGEAIAEIETDKATVELEAYESGVMARIYVPEGVTVPVGETIGIIAMAGEDAGAIPVSGTAGQASTAPATMPEPQAAATAPDTMPAPAASETAQAPVTPVARRIAEEAGVSLDDIRANVTGTGPGGRVTKGDVEAYLSARVASTEPAAPLPATAPDTTGGGIGIVVPGGLTPMRQAIARRMSLSKLTAPHYYVTVDIDMTRASQMRRELNEQLEGESRLTVNDMIVKAIAMTLKTYANFNVTVLAEGIRPNATIDVSMAVAMEGGGLLAPSLPDVGDASLVEIARRTKNMVTRAREGRLRPNEIGGIGFAVSNLGMYAVKDFVAIITPPNAGAVAVGAVLPTPVARDGQIVIADMMSATLSADHRATDGAEGAQFMNELRRILERPSLLLL